MDESTPAPEVAVIRDVCQQNRAEPEAIWDALEAQGIDTTPGMIYQALNLSQDGDEPPVLTPHAGPDGGLTADDLITLGVLAAKAGGVEQLQRILAVWQGTPK